jgi:ABC-type taurine transport system substrate-binding protein
VTLRLGYFPNITHPRWSAWARDLQGHLAPNVTLETSTFNSGTEASEALFADAIDLTYIGPNPAINAYAKSNGEAVRVISGATSGGAFLVVKPDINGPADLKGKKLATPSLGNTQDVALRSWLKENGLSADEAGGGDVSIAPQENSQTLQTFISGDIQGAWVPEPWATRLVQEGWRKVLVDERDLWPDGKYVTTHVMVATKFLNDHPDVVKQFLEGRWRPTTGSTRTAPRPRRWPTTRSARSPASPQARGHLGGVAEPHLHRRPDRLLADHVGQERRGHRPAQAGRQPPGHLRPDPAQPGPQRGRPAGGVRA